MPSTCGFPEADLLYRGLLRIEESFKITKSEFKIRPVYLSRQDHIRAHFLVCFVALLIIRLLQKRMGDTYPVGQMIDSLKRANASSLEDNWWLFDYRDDALDDMAGAFGLDLSHRYLRTADIRSLVASTKRQHSLETTRWRYGAAAEWNYGKDTVGAAL